MSRRDRALVAPVVAVVLGATLALTGCSLPTPSGGTGGNGGSGGTSGGSDTPDDGSDASDDGADDGSDTDTDTGSPFISGQLPNDWPAVVTVPEGEIVQSVSMDGSGWLALIDATDPQAGFAASSASLQGSGFAVVSESTSDHGSVGIYENDELQVQVAVTDAPESGWNMSYTITKKG